MLIRKAPDLRFSDITPRSLYLRRREFLQTAAGAALGAAAAVVGSPLVAQVQAAQQREGTGHGAKLANVKKSPLSTTGETLTSFDDITSYNNFYEYGPYKEDPKAQAWRLKPRPWTITVEGYAAKKGTFGFDEFTQPYTLEERVYRMRCVEAWSMVIPWQGVPLADLIKRFEPSPSAKYVAFTTVFRPDEMPGQRRPVLDRRSFRTGWSRSAQEPLQIRRRWPHPGRSSKRSGRHASEQDRLQLRLSGQANWLFCL